MIHLEIDSDKSLDKQFAEAKKEWQHVKRRGNDTRCWTDGMYMNLIRSKMIRLRKMKRVDFENEDISKWEIPEKVDYEFNHRDLYKEKRR